MSDGALPRPAEAEKRFRLIVDNSEPVAGFVANDSFTIRKAGASSGGGGNRMPGDSDHPLSAFTLSSDFQASLECDAC